MARYVVGVSGASGVILAQKALRALSELGHEIELVMTHSALYTATIELGKEFGKAARFVDDAKNVNVHSNNDIGCSIASGTYPTSGMVIIPCSLSTVAAISIGLGDNLLRRAADVTLKEKRPLVIVPRETPLSQTHLRNLLRLAELGATIVPPIPAWYMKPKSLEEIETFIIGRVFDALGVVHTLYIPWQP